MFHQMIEKCCRVNDCDRIISDDQRNDHIIMDKFVFVDTLQWVYQQKCVFNNKWEKTLNERMGVEEKNKNLKKYKIKKWEGKKKNSK